MFEIDGLEPVESKLLLATWISIKKNFNSDSPFQAWNRGRTQEFLETSFHRLLSQRRIYKLNSQVYKTLTLDKKFCTMKWDKSREKCSKVNALYLPEFDAILINDQLPKIELEKVLFHEIVHAYQYHYLLFYYLHYFHELSQYIYTYPNFSIEEYIKFNFEAIAHWYTISLFEDKAWLKYSANEQSWWGPPGKKQSDETLALHGVTFLEPKEDFYVLKKGHFGIDISKQKSAFYSPWPLISKRHRGGYSPERMKRYDYETHRHFIDRLKEAQWGINTSVDQRAMFNEPQIILSSVSNIVYEKLLHPKGETKSCDHFFTNLLMAKEPLVEIWRTSELSNFGSCKNLPKVSKARRKELIDKYLEADMGKSFKVDPLIGGAGTSPDINIHPQLLVEP